ncbi:MAG: putative Ig domain-containing protein [Deltaproteobacteria bacterium]|nr:putative Ig domain-containing protein [Deltaproteobacteria bacterium]
MGLALPATRLARTASLCALAGLLLACGGSAPEQQDGESSAARDPADANAAPQITRVSLKPENPAPGSAVRVLVEARDPDGDSLEISYEWTRDGEPAGSGSPKLSLGGATRDERVEVTVTASDGRLSSKPATASVQLANRPPRVERLRIGPALEITVGDEVVIEAQVVDEDGDPVELSYEWELNERPLPDEGPRLSTDSFEPGDVITVEVQIDDGTDEGEPLASPPIEVVNRPPRVVSRPGRSAGSEGFYYKVQAEDPDGDTSLRFTLEEAPAGMEIDTTSGEITWSPESDQAGAHTVKVVVDDGEGGRILHAFRVRLGSSESAVADLAPRLAGEGVR